jgi:hypothetical protein
MEVVRKKWKILYATYYIGQLLAAGLICWNTSIGKETV